MVRTTRLLAGLTAVAVLVGCSGSDGDDADAADITDVELSAVGEEAPTTTIGENPLEVEPLAEAPTELIITELSTGAGRAAQAGDTVWVDYVGVIIGPDLVVRDGEVVVDASKRAKYDKSVRGLKKLTKSEFYILREAGGMPEKL